MKKRLLAFLLITSCLCGFLSPAFAEEGLGGPPSEAAAVSQVAPAPEPVADSAGTVTGGAADVVGVTAGAPTAEELATMGQSEPLAAKLADVVGHNRIAINMVWVMVCGFLVMFMQAGFAMAEGGFTRAKNAGHTMAMNFMIYGIGILGYWMCGFAIQMGGVGGIASLGGAGVLNSEFVVTLFGKDFGLFGTKGFFLSGTYDVAVYAIFLFQMVFMDTTATIPTGSMAERWTFKSFVVYGFFITALVYPLYANWVWGGGWLSQLGKNFALGHGHVDFAGSSVVHMTGGVAALAGAMVLGPRLGKYKADGTPNAIPGHHIPMAIVGCFILAFGWFGFNAGSTLAGGDFRLAVVATNTMLASAAGAFSAMAYMWIVYGKPDISMIANGFLAGLVAVTAPCAFVDSGAAVFIGAVGGILLCMSVFFVERVLKVDDPVGAISVHGVNGAWGVLALGLFADGTYGDGLNRVKGTVKGLLYGDSGQFLAQVIGTVTNIIFVFVVMYVFFKVLDKIVPLRVSPEMELEGLDQSEVGVNAYPEFNLTKTHR
ncbi:MAG: ammonium transporter [Desulfurivibrionaceae bacterium]|jgi:Amt family ammonium transporter